MNRLKIYILLFCLAAAVPLSYVIWRTYTGVAREEQAQLRYFAETLFDDMERELTDLIQREEKRAVDEYSATLFSTKSKLQTSPLAQPPKEDYILGYLQNNPDGDMQTPLVEAGSKVPPRYRSMVDQLEEINRIFNDKKWSLPGTAEPPSPVTIVAKVEKKEQASKSFADRYLAPSKRKAAKKVLGQKEVRMEEISQIQARNLTNSKSTQSIKKDEADYESEAADAVAVPPQAQVGTAVKERSARTPAVAQEPQATISPEGEQRFQVEVAPMQSVFIDDDQIFIFRRMVINDRIFRQGFILRVKPFLQHLAKTHFEPHPMAGFTQLSLMVMNRGRQNEIVRSGVMERSRQTIVERTFPTPFNFISAAVLGDEVPPSPARRTLNFALVALGLVMLVGFATIYQSVRSVVELSERRSQFVSSVTHELKTPLTNIRMYVEMLEQGIAATPEREQDYLGIVGSESTRLSRLINNVLELAKLEKKQRMVDMQPGHLEDLLAEVRSVMSPKLDQEGFQLDVCSDPALVFPYDREAMLQILINLIENSIKFGRNATERQIAIRAKKADGWVRLTVSDTGPGIPRQSLKRVFDDFYRADNALTRTTSGTGIGLALVKKLVQAMGGRVQASNHSGGGCSITIKLPAGHKTT